MMEPQIGAEVKDSKGKLLGNIDYLVRDTWTGEARKYIIYRKPPEQDIAFTPDDIANVLESEILLTIAVD